MSWSYSGIGTPTKIAASIDSAIEGYSGQSKAEFEEAAPHLKALILGNVGQSVVVNVSASGSAGFDQNGKKTSGNVNVKIEPYWGFVGP